MQLPGAELIELPDALEEMLQNLELHHVPLADEHKSSDGIPWPQIYGHYLEQCRTIHDAIRARPQLRPDLVVAHGGRGAPSLFLREVVDCPIINYCEYYFATSHRDISYRIDLPPAEPAQFFPRCINAPTLAALVNCDAGYSATHWQKQSFPARFHPKIEVHFDGIDTVALPARARTAEDRRAGRSRPGRRSSRSSRAGWSRSGGSTCS